MATTVHEPPQIGQQTPETGHPGRGGRDLLPNRSELRGVQYSPPPASMGVWVGLFAITMTFAAFTSALVVRKSSADWRHLALPSILYWNTLVLLASSVTLEAFRRRAFAFTAGL